MNNTFKSSHLKLNVSFLKFSRTNFTCDFVLFCDLSTEHFSKELVMITHSQAHSVSLSFRLQQCLRKFSVMKFPQKKNQSIKALSIFSLFLHFIYTSARIILAQSRFSTQALNILSTRSRFWFWITIRFLLQFFSFIFINSWIITDKST